MPMKLTSLAAILLALSAAAQPSVPTLADLCAGQVPDEFDAALHADDFCALLAHKPAAARQHLSTAIQRNRAANNPNRLYLDARRGSEPGLYIQLLRPWMAAQSAAGTADWRVLQHRGMSDYYSIVAVQAEPLYPRNPPAVSEFHYDTIAVRIVDMSDATDDRRVIGFDLKMGGVQGKATMAHPSREIGELLYSRPYIRAGTHRDWVTQSRRGSFNDARVVTCDWRVPTGHEVKRHLEAALDAAEAPPYYCP